MKLSFTTSLPTSINSLYQNKAFYNPRTKTYQATGQRILSKEGRAMKAKIRAEAILAVKESGWNIEELGDKFVYMDTVIYFNRRGRDADNIFKALQDSLQGVVFNNDSQVLSRTQRILFDADNPRLELTIYPVSYIGIFSNQADVDKFEAICQSCSRYRKGSCSILKDSIAGTIREEISDINNPICSKYKTKKSK